MIKPSLQNNTLSPRMLYWENEKGVEFLRQVGIDKGDSVLDFGCRVGHYTIPAAKVVGNRGSVYAIDTEENALAEVERKKKKQNLSNIKIVKTSGQLTLPLEDESVDVVLFYDVLHYLEKSDRKKLYRQTRRILKQEGFLSVYPKHILKDDPIQEFREMGLEDVIKEIESSGFGYQQKYCGLISHDDDLNQGCVINFRKG